MMQIRAITGTDIKAFQDVMKISIAGICTNAYGATTTAAWVSDKNPAFHFKIPEFAFLVEEDGQIIVVGGWSLTDKVDLHPNSDQVIEKPTHARINAVYVRPNFEGRGLGQHMIAHLEADIMTRSSVRDVYLWSTINAIPFYQAMGYTGGIDQFPEVAEGHKIQVRYMWKRLG
ncbi:MAG: GNAT family N-acetyltransferase [Emcibacter sp.]|nr:GNAT family N-acetyltransferase [Emcibacter sp.]